MVLRLFQFTVALIAGDVPPPEEFKDSYFFKDFGTYGIFAGVCVRMCQNGHRNGRDDVFHIRYDDGDTEELCYSDVKRLIRRAPASRADYMSGAKRRRKKSGAQAKVSRSDGHRDSRSSKAVSSGTRGGKGKAGEKVACKRKRTPGGADKSEAELTCVHIATAAEIEPKDELPQPENEATTSAGSAVVSTKATSPGGSGDKGGNKCVSLYLAIFACFKVSWVSEGLFKINPFDFNRLEIPQRINRRLIN